MSPVKNFSRFLTAILVLFVGASLAIVVGSLYGILSNSMTNEFYHRLKVQQVELGMILQDRFNLLETRLKEITLDSQVIMALLTGLDRQVLVHMMERYPCSNGALYIIYCRKRDSFIPELPEQYSHLKTFLTKMYYRESQKYIKFRSNGHDEFYTLLSLPIINMNDRLGTAFLFYNISKDKQFWVRSQRHSYVKLLINHNNGLFDMQSGEKVSGKNKKKQSFSTRGIGSATVEFLPEESLMPLLGFPDLFLGASSEPIREKKRLLFLNLAILCSVVLLLTLFISFFIARKVGKPLERMANEAIKIANNPSNLLLKEDKLSYTEFKKLAQAFNRVLSGLVKAQEDLQKKAKKEIDESEELYKRTVEAAPDIISITRLFDGRFLKVNEAFEKITGYTAEEIIGKTPQDLDIYVDNKEREQMVSQIYEKGEVNGLEIKMRHKDGNISDAIFSARRTRFAGEECLVAVVSDNTRRKRAEEKVRRAKETLQAILSSMPFGVVIIDKNKKIMSINNEGLNLIGYDSEEDVINRFCTDIMCPVERDSCPIYDLGEKVDKNESILLTKDGKEIPILKSVTPITVDNETVLIEAFLDLTEFKKAEKEKKSLELQLQHATKMEAIGTLAGGVAHDLNNILAGLVSYPELLLMEIPDDSPLRKPVLTIQKSGERAAAIVQDLLTLARRGVTVTEVVNLNNIILEYLNSPEHEKLMSYHHGVQIELDLTSDLLNILGSGVHLSKTIMNLVSNAAEAMPGGGVINITSKNEYIDMPVKGYDNIEEGDYVTIQVSDKGMGISLEDKERIFEPFYTNKKMGKSGTGLGMAVVWGTVKDHNGYIDVESIEGNGTVFRLYFPVTRKKINTSNKEEDIKTYTGRGEKILVVDDMEEQRAIAESILNKLDYSVKTVSSGEEAIEYVKKNSVDLLILDMIMEPGIDGLETYRRILEICPGQKAIIASGYSETDRVKETQKLGAGTYIKKPYLLERIGMAVRSEIDKG